MSLFCDITTALRDIQQGKPLIVVDDEDRENEGDIVVAAECITPECINFMATHAKGLICTPVEKSIADRLDFHPMVSKEEEGVCNFAISVDLREGIETGISTADRAKTILHIIKKESRAEDFIRPGHIFPLRAKEGGVLVRAGHTEASVDLSRLAGFQGAAVICEIMNKDGTMARLPDLREFAKKHDLHIFSIADLISYRHGREQLVEEVERREIQTPYGAATLALFREHISGEEHIALITPWQDTPFVRVHVESGFGDLFPVFQETKAENIHKSLAHIQKAGGVFVSLNASKKSPSELHFPGGAQVPPNYTKSYGIGSQILELLGIQEMRLISDTEPKIIGLSAFNIKILETIPLEKL